MKRKRTRKGTYTLNRKDGVMSYPLEWSTNSSQQKKITVEPSTDAEEMHQRLERTKIERVRVQAILINMDEREIRARIARKIRECENA